ncbi:MAG: hypothetical protein EZS28_011296 [Streblomastix strix]|uniref:Uncharacterized protein n=1 Tax=Streblomastix strix TaxID=222440 RepID=A0A5J4WEQ7_9EUKA|nr:MAG: hypothetical protein EZS28_011296 [Streblomastix strix]
MQKSACIFHLRNSTLNQNLSNSPNKTLSQALSFYPNRMIYELQQHLLNTVRTIRSDLRKSQNKYPASPNTLKCCQMLVHLKGSNGSSSQSYEMAQHNLWNPQLVVGRTTRVNLGFKHIQVPIQLQRRKMEEVDPCSEQATNDQKKMVRDREMTLDALVMNSDKVPKYNLSLDLPDARQNSVNGVIVQMTAAGIDALIANNFLVLMDVLLTQLRVGRIIVGDGLEQREVAVALPYSKSLLA